MSPSGYYKWLQNAEKQAVREESDYQDYVFLKEIYDEAQGKIGYRGLYMKVTEKAGQPMNHKKILRLMRKFHFFAKVRRANPYRTMAKATEVHRQVPNHLNRQFDQQEPGKVFLTAITYLQIRGEKTAYLSCVKEMRLIQSMSRRGNYLDNAPMESFFEHMKDEVPYKQANSIAELKYLIDDYMDHYKNTRKQWT